MSVDPRISLNIVRKEIQDCREDSQRFRWEFSEIDGEAQIFMVKMTSPVDKEQYILEFKFDHYKEWPLLIEFIHSNTGQRGVKAAYPAPNSKAGGFFHEKPCICHPCSRNAYGGYSGVHGDWKIDGWQQNPGCGNLKNIQAILRAIYSRISNPDTYRGRMRG
jgi:hypothetical protein